MGMQRIDQKKNKKKEEKKQAQVREMQVTHGGNLLPMTTWDVL